MNFQRVIESLIVAKDEAYRQTGLPAKAAIVVPQAVFIAILAERTHPNVPIDPNAVWVDLGGIFVINETMVTAMVQAIRPLLGRR